MALYTDGSAPVPVLGNKSGQVNELFLASFHVATYIGCEYGCGYCDSRSYSDNPIDLRITALGDLPGRLAEELLSIDPGEAVGLTLGEPYQPAEQVYRVTRSVLQVLNQRKQPCIILTKSPSVLDDIELLQEMNHNSLAAVVFTVVTSDHGLSSFLEPGAPDLAWRVKTVHDLKHAGVPTGFALVPVFPFLTDGEEHLARTLELFVEAEPDFVVWEYLWLPNGSHKKQMQRLLQRYDEGLWSKYEELYLGGPQPDLSYRSSRDIMLLKHCRRLGLEPRIPTRLYANRLTASTVAELTSRRKLFINQVGAWE